MKKKLYLKPMTKMLFMKQERIMVTISKTEIDDGFSEGAKGGFFDEEDNILPRGKNVWADEF